MGGIGTNCLTLVKSSKYLTHVIIVLEGQGRLSGIWEEAGAYVYHLNTSMKELLIFPGRLKERLNSVRNRFGKPERAILWTSSLFPLISARIFDNAKILIHFGNPNNKSLYNLIINFGLYNLLNLKNSNLAFFAPSNHVIDSFRSYFFFKNFPFYLVPNGIDNEKLDGKRWRIPQESNVAMVARLDAIKDHLTLIFAINGLKRNDHDVKLVLVGGGQLESKLKQQVEELDLNESVVFTGEKDFPFEDYLNWRLFVFSTTDREGFGNVLAEALSVGLPCLVSEIGPTPEFDRSSKAIEYFEAGNVEQLSEKILGLLNDPERLKGMSERSIELSKKFTGNQFTQSLLEIFKER